MVFHSYTMHLARWCYIARGCSTLVTCKVWNVSWCHWSHLRLLTSRTSYFSRNECHGCCFMQSEFGWRMNARGKHVLAFTKLLSILWATPCLVDASTGKHNVCCIYVYRHDAHRPWHHDTFVHLSVVHTSVAGIPRYCTCHGVKNDHQWVGHALHDSTWIHLVHAVCNWTMV